MMSKYKLAMASMLMLIAFTGMSSAMAADGTTGEIDFDQTSVSEDTMVYVHFKDLTGGADYLVNWTGDDTGYSFTTGSSQDDIYIPITFSKPASGNAFVLNLRYQSAGTSIDSITVYVTEMVISSNHHCKLIKCLTQQLFSQSLYPYLYSLL